MKNNSKNAFWQAFLVTIAIFVIGLFLGISYENRRIGEVNEDQILSEILLMDSLASSNLAQTGHASCENLIQSNIDFANRIYSEALILDKYEDAEILTDQAKIVRKRYDLLRTLLWIDILGMPKDCFNETSVIVYLYNYDTNDLTNEAKNSVWSKVLFDLKTDLGDQIILIPIAANGDLTSLNTLASSFNISDYPVIIIDNEHVITDLTSAEDLKIYLN